MNRTAGRAVSAWRGVLPLLVLGVLVLGGGAAPAGAWEAPPVVWEEGRCTDLEFSVECYDARETESGQRTVEMRLTRGIATDPTSGDVFVADQGDQRIDELTPWGEFVKAWGWGVRDGASALETCTAATGCREGLAGAGPGQFNQPQGLATDAEGNVYVADLLNDRVQKFDGEGHFLLMFGGEVDKGPNHPGNACTAAYIAEGDTCGAGSNGPGEGQFGWIGSPKSIIATAPAGQVYVGDVNRIERFDGSGVYQGQLPLPEPGEVGALAVQPTTGDLYFAYAVVFGGPENPNLYKLAPSTGKELGKLEVHRPQAIATDAAGDLFVYEEEGGGAPRARLVEFDPSGAMLGVIDEQENSAEVPFGQLDTGIATGSACFSKGAGVYYSRSGTFGSIRSHVLAYGIPDKLELCPPPKRAPRIADQYALAVGADSATVGARIGPEFWPHAKYYVQYGTSPCAQGGCASEPAPPGADLGAKITNGTIATADVTLTGLSPGTTYYYRFVAESAGGGPAYGGGEGEASFRTQPLPGEPNTGCANRAFRIEASLSLPDCRAYEMVSPVDKEGGDVSTRYNAAGFLARLDQSAVSGEAITYSSYRSFDGSQSAQFSSQYMARRDPQHGWQTQPMSPPAEGAQFVKYIQVDNLYRAFTPELDTSWLYTNTEPVLGAGGLAGYANIYRHDKTGAYSACTTQPPQFQEVHGPQLQGISADQNEAVFEVRNKYTADASNEAKNELHINQLYVCSYGEGPVAKLRLLSVLPNGTPSNVENTVGNGPDAFQTDEGRATTLAHAVSSDGSRVYWTAAPYEGEAGTLYVRLNPTRDQSAIEGGRCTEPEAACTLPIAGSSRFAAASADGSLAFYIKEGAAGLGDLKEYELEREVSRLIAHKVAGVVGASEDGSSLYFVSYEAFDGAKAGEPNLYMYTKGSEEEPPSYTYVATISERDARSGLGWTPDSPEPAHHTARVSADGRFAVFMSDNRALSLRVAKYDNTDQVNGLPDNEVYRYDAATKRLACLSCNQTGVRPIGTEVVGTSHFGLVPQQDAARIAPWLNSLYAPRVMSADGQRVFFESSEALVLNDTNGAGDVYEWESAGTGDCTTASATFVTAAEGCVSLISSGKSPSDSEFVDASQDGRDVFIRTAASLVSYDPGQVDIYDARVDGGFAPPPPAPLACEGEACQRPAQTPVDQTPSSLSFDGASGAPAGEAGKHVTPRKLTRAQRLARALAVCKHKPKRKRARCRANARRKYRVKAAKARRVSR